MDLDSKMSARSRNRRLIFPLITLVVAGFFVWTSSARQYNEARLGAAVKMHIQRLITIATSDEDRGRYDEEPSIDAFRQQQLFMDRQAISALEELIPPLQIASLEGEYSSGIRFAVEGGAGGRVTVVIKSDPVEVIEVIRGEE